MGEPEAAMAYYGRNEHQHFFACFAMFVYARDDLKRCVPIGFEMVESVLSHEAEVSTIPKRPRPIHHDGRGTVIALQTNQHPEPIFVAPASETLVIAVHLSARNIYNVLENCKK